MAKLDEQISTLQERLRQLKVRQQHVEARQRALDEQRRRKSDTRRQILIGKLILDKLGRGEMDAVLLRSWLQQSLTRPADRALFDLDAPPADAPHD